ncbi:MAG: RtcB family protein [Thiohalocapsa sp. PB-PSB1]|jgi:tRNA-splicing ligase RtcB|nr:MAG: RTCB protein [Thiohalocapsa sp. PB-PSB1]QQO55775.1 MAG: RtcB family protein [Thiohalocapsa sp. PB-PSB1]HCS89297.1 RtcB family protein [Chromatiaceae bacterium]
MPIQRVLTTGRVPVKIYTDDVSENALQQLANVSQLPFIHHHVAAMPDVHWGMGATIGSVIPTVGAIVPAAVGVDIGCGMSAIRLSLTAEKLPDSLVKVRAAIEKVVPVGMAGHAEDAWCNDGLARVAPGLQPILDKHPKINARWQSQLGSLGGGNHFIELCLDEVDRVWVMLHSGSRGIGNRIGQYFIAKAQREMERWHIQLPDKNLAYLPEESELFEDYMQAVGWAQEYALENRRQMLRLILDALRRELPSHEVTDEAIECHHNYVAREYHYGKNLYLTRKGAIRARDGDLGIIPGSMGARSYIVRGKGVASAFCSCSHGAGRRMSRGEATRRFTRKDLEQQTEGVECRKDKGVIDEIPGAYKDIDTVMAHQSDLVDVVHRLKQVLTVKG